MMLKIFTPVVNSPEFLNLQVSKFIENLECDFQIIAIDDSNDPVLGDKFRRLCDCLLYTSPSPRDRTRSRMPSSA